MVMTTSFTLAQHFSGRGPTVKATYAALLRAARALGLVREEPKKTSIHLARNTAFAGIATRRDGLILTLKASADIKSPRIRKHEQASANRWHLDLRLAAPGDVDAELRSWLRAAYALAG
jgi:hypothetical protein